MPIPKFTENGCLPPYEGASPTRSEFLSPYSCTSTELLGVLGWTPKRKALIQSLMSFRAALHKLGVVRGYQLLDGSFAEIKEVPNDIDVVTLYYRPKGTAKDADFKRFWDAHPEVFTRAAAKKSWNIDSQMVDLNGDPGDVAAAVTFWCALFSHQRDSKLWKGMVKIELGTKADDDEVLKQLKELRP